MQKPRAWRKTAIQAIEKRKMSEMQWQLALTVLAQPAFNEDAAREKSQMIQDIYSALSDEEEEEFVPMDDADTIALLAMAGRYPIRKIDGPGNTS